MISAMHESTLKRHPEFPLAEADLCVKCGLCLPHCPTYAMTRHEGDSPRGRIALMQGLATAMLSPTPKLAEHLDGCLSCRACEPVCPAKVPYGRLIDAGRAMLNTTVPQRSRLPRVLGLALTRRLPRRLLTAIGWLYQRCGLQHLLRARRLLGHGRLARLESLLPQLPLRPFASYTAAKSGGAAVALFTGCVSEMADGDTLRATQRLLGRLGIAAAIPSSQTCCGALYQHAGLPDQAADCARRNADAFRGSGAVLGTASGCTATLLDAPQLIGGEGAALRDATRDIHDFLLERWDDSLRLDPLPLRVAVHTPCTLRNVIGGSGKVTALLRKIPQIELVELDASQSCCGAAGSYFLSQPEMADRLLSSKLESAERLAPQIIVSSNIGCSLHLAAGLQRRGTMAPELLHPVQLLARQLADG